MNKLEFTKKYFKKIENLKKNYYKYHKIDLKIKIDNYIKQHRFLEKQYLGDSTTTFRSTLPLSIKILENLNNDDFNITNNSLLVEDIYFSCLIPNHKQQNLDIIKYTESELVKNLIQYCENKKILIYMMISNITMVDGNLYLKSKIKIMN